MKYQVYSAIKEEDLTDARVLVIDSIGLLSSLYQYGDMAYVGGAFGEGLHNILEAATFGLPILFGKGKDNHKYQEAIDLLEKGGAFEVANANELTTKVKELLGDKSGFDESGNVCKDYVTSKAGATDKIMEYLKQYLT